MCPHQKQPAVHGVTGISGAGPCRRWLMTLRFSSQLVTATLRPVCRSSSVTPFRKRKYILLAFLLCTDVKTSEPPLSEKFVLHPTPDLVKLPVPENSRVGEAICESQESACH